MSGKPATNRTISHGLPDAGLSRPGLPVELGATITCLLTILCLPLAASPILGSWYLDDGTGAAVVTFLPNHEFIFIQDGDATLDPTGQDGMERGTWSWNMTTGDLATAVTLDTNLAWGFSHGIAGVPGVTAMVVAETLTVTIPGEGSFSLERVAGASPLTGAWWTAEGGQPGACAMITFLQDGAFFLAQIGNPASDPGGTDGIERGTWSWNAATDHLTTTVKVDTNGEWGLSHAGASKTVMLHPRGQRLSYTNSVDPGSVSFYKVRPISFQAWTVEHSLSGANAQPSATPFADDIPNLLRHAMNLDPAPTPAQRASAMAVGVSIGGSMQLEYRRRSGLHGVSLIPQYSHDLVTWADVPAPLIVDAGLMDPETNLMRANIPPPAGPAKCFARLKAVGLSITTQPLATTIRSGTTTTLTVAAAGSSPVSYQWYEGSAGATTTPVGTNSSSFTTPALTGASSYWVRITSADGTLDSDAALVTVAVPPGMITQPASVTINSGSTATLGVAVAGTGPFAYQWYQGVSGVTTTPVGGNSPVFTTPVLTTSSYSTLQYFWVKVTNAAGSTNSAAAEVTVRPPLVPPAVTTQPVSTTVASGGNRTLFVSASGSFPLTYQWYQGSAGTTATPVGSNSSSFTTPSLTSTTSYWVRISNTAGSVDSLHATVTVLAAPSIGTQPASTAVDSGLTATLSVSASGSAPITYQWYQGTRGSTTSPVGTNAPSFTTPPLTATTSYWVRLTNELGTVDSAGATVVVGAEMSLIPAGGFTMGRTGGDTDSNAPSVTVSLSGFHIGRHEVPKAQWDEIRTWGLSNGYSDLPVGGGKTANHPVTNVSWWSAVKWCNARSEKEGLSPVYRVAGAVMKTGFAAPVVNWSANGYRLPTEAEWEKAARGGVAGKRFPSGYDTISHGDANFMNDGGEPYQTGTTGYHPVYARLSFPYTSPIGSFTANGYGLHDTAGNVCEWCWDWYSASSYTNGSSDPCGPATGSSRVLRGGSWLENASIARASQRAAYTPDSSYNYLGFRVARSSAP